MLRLVVRLAAAAALAAAMAIGVFDGARSIADGFPQAASIADLAQWLTARGFAPGGPHSFVREGLAAAALALPAMPILFLLGLGLLAAGQTKARRVAAPE